MPLTRLSPEAVAIRSIVISERVSVPVLSEAMTEAEPRVSTEESFLTMALRAAMRCTPMASTTERMAGSPSGTAATASDTPSSSTSTHSPGVRSSVVRAMLPTTTAEIAITAIPSIRPIRRTSFCSGVLSSTVASSMPAIAPISVSIPVAVTSARPLPWATAVPLNTMSRRSPIGAGAGRAAVAFRTASLSPVSDASLTRSAAASNRRASAPTASPSASTSRSPRTSSSLGTRSSWPSRTTDEVTAVIRASAATASCALASCR
jgi:hypothetical protein